MKKPHHAKEILDAFEKHWGNEGRPSPELKHDEPLDGLMLTLLSQNTNDKNRDKAFEKLKAEYPKWDRVAEAPIEKVVDLIRVAGLGDTKAKHMKQILVILKEKFGRYSLIEMQKWKVEEAREFLVSLPGVGVKTAGCVLIFDLDMPAFPVDTHVARISRRLGWVPEKMAPDKIQEYLESTLPPERFRGAHLNIIEHGRGICSARKPDCKNCFAEKRCQFTKSLDG
ncbi:MAG: endonuclease III [Synergistaceae bacterium]|nr:endonuclease III [Synergistaceae bacterium]